MLLGIDVDVVETSRQLSSLTNGKAWSDLAQLPWFTLQSQGVDRYVAVLANPNLMKAGNKSTTDLSLIGRLERLGVLVVKERTCVADHPGATVRLAGGSVCSTHLDLDELCVRKTLRPTRLNFLDGRGRHTAEFAFMSMLPAGWRHLFPAANLTTTDAEGDLTLEMEFVRGYSLGERVLRGEFTPYRLCRLIDDLLSELSCSVWRSRPTSLQRSYFDIVRRRFRDLMVSETFARLWTDGAIVNGVRLPALEKLLTAAEAKWPKLGCLQGNGAHGDLVLEDILVVPSVSGDEIKLVDPNPQNVSGFIDIAKLMMSARLKYEVIYAGQYKCDWRIANDSLEVIFAVSRSTAWSCLDDLAEQLERRAQELSVTRSAGTRPNAMLEAQACLNMLALPSFHHIHHGEYERSMMFTVVGMARLHQLVA